MKFRNILHISVAALLCTASISAATIDHTWVSRSGSDSNPCTSISPCLTFQGALANTAPGGSITALDVGDFGPVTIKQSVTIDGNNLGSITFTGYAAISISGVTNVTVQNLTINGLGSGGYGIDADNQGFVTVHNCEVMSFIGDGIVFGGSGALTVENSRILSFAGSSGVGIYMTGSGNVVVKNTFIDASPLGLNRDGFAVWDGAGSVKASLQNVTIMGAGGAAVSAGAGFTEITDSILTQSAYGVFIFDNRGTISVANSLITANQTGLCIGALSTIRLDNNDIFDNPTAIANCGGSVNTGGNNKISGNIAISDSVVSDTVTF